MLKAICKRQCTTPEHGMVDKGQRVEFSRIDDWDLEKYPYLKWFSEFKAQKPAPVKPEADQVDHVVEKLGKRIHEMSPDDIDSLGAKEIGEAYGISWKGRKKDDVISDALKMDTHGET